MQISSNLNVIVLIQMQVKQRPAGLLDAITIQILNKQPIPNPHNLPISSGNNHTLALIAAIFFPSRGKVNPRPSRTCSPACMRTTCKVPNLPRLEWQDKFWLHQIIRNKRLNGKSKGETK